MVDASGSRTFCPAIFLDDIFFMRIDEVVTVRQKAGVIPYYFDSKNILRMMFMTPSDPKYGGSQFQIAKGRIEAGEDVQQAAIRESEEELGLLPTNVIQVKSLGTRTITGLDETYQLTVFVAEIKNPKAFGPTDFETGDRAWLTLEQFVAKGRQSQLAIVQQANNILRADGRDQRP